MSGFLDRWQRRRAAVAEEEAKQAREEAEELESSAMPGEAVEAVESDQAAEVQEEPEAPLPDPEEIEEGGSFAAFMRPDVAADKRQEALRALWKQPHYNVRDGLCEYDLDYAAQPKLSAKVAAELAEKVFRHMVKDVEEGAESAVAQLDKKSPEPTGQEQEPGQKVASEEGGADDGQTPA
ncbi:DUF3306 domain-containing protein [Ferrimonas gelatinilytica]|uniref:DUF3306 domain-containing protein n=1 Tax=Ferrimonas gelatinilytica TaxID=1255257 RepID=A0ABP9RTY0_9GAMM